MTEFESLNFFQWIYKHLKSLLIIEVIALALSIVFSSQYFIHKEYKSYAVVYPSNMADYSHESPCEQMIEFLNSVDIKDEVIDKFNLRKHYFNLSRSKKITDDKLYGEYDRNVVVSPTLFRAVELDVYDINPDTAYQMVNYILDVLNNKILRVQKEKALEVANMWKTQLDLKEHQIDSMTNIARQLSKQYGLLEYNSQSREISKAYYEVLAFGKNSKQADEITKQMQNIEDYGIIFRTMNEHIETAVGDENALGVRYEDAMKDVNRHFTYWNLVSAPYINNSSSYPSRMLIVLCSCAAALIFSILFIRTLERIRH